MIKKYIALLLFSLSVFTALPLFAQFPDSSFISTTIDSLRSPVPPSDSSSTSSSHEKKMEEFPENYTVNLMNSPSPSYDMIVSRFIFLNSFDSADQYQTGFNLYDNFILLNSNDLLLPDSLKSVSRLNVILGAKREQLLYIDHKQNLGKKFGLNLSYNASTSPGFIAEQLAKYRGFSIGGSFTSKYYAASLQYSYRKVTASECGGVNDSLVVKGLSKSDILTLPVQLSAASNEIRSHVGSLNQSIILYKSNFDSTGSNKLTLNFISTFNQKGWVYKDQGTSSFYENTYVDSLTYDTSTVQDFSNQGILNYSIQKGKESIFSGVEISAGLSRHDIQQQLTIAGSDINYMTALSRVKLNVMDFQIDAALNYVYAGNQKVDDNSYLLSVNREFKTGFLNRFSFTWNANNLAPGSMLKQYSSNHFVWDNPSFVNEKITEAGAEIGFFKNIFTLFGTINTYTDKIYFNTEALPKQFNGDVKLLKGGLKLNSSFHHFGFYGEFTWQDADNEIIRVPDFNFFGRIAYRNQYFKAALKVEFGISMLYYTGYYGLDYMPATGQYFLQNANSIGNEPCFNLFTNFGIGTAVVYLKLEQANYNLFGNPYFAAPGYPSPSRTFKFGVKWMLKN